MCSKSITYCIDTNILVEFARLDLIPWREFDSDIAEIRIVIPTKVGEEMDEHKKKNGKLRRRAIEFSTLSRRIEDSPNGVVVMRKEDPRVTAEFGPLFRKSELDGDRFELDDSDNRVVAEVAAIAQTYPDAVFLADDSKPIRLARKAGLKCTRPLSSWRRTEGQHERDKEIAELKREIGARPHLTLSLGGALEAKQRLILLQPPEETDTLCSEAFRRTVHEEDPQVSRDELLREHGYSDTRSALSLGLGGLTLDQLNRYHRDYERFSENVFKISEDLARVFRSQSFTLPLTVIAGNAGDRAADRVKVTATLSAPFTFAPADTIAKFLKDNLTAPTPPKPIDHLLPAFNNILNDIDHSPRRQDIFHTQDEPTSGQHTTTQSWRCEELRQSDTHQLNMLITSKSEDAAGVLTLTITSATIAKPTVMSVPLACKKLQGKAGRDFFLSNLMHIPTPYQLRFRSLLEKI